MWAQSVTSSVLQTFRPPRRRILHTDVLPLRKSPLHDRQRVFDVDALSFMSCIVYHCTRSLEHACMSHVILVSAQGSEMRTRKEGASGRRIGQALQIFGGPFLSTRAVRIFLVLRVDSDHEPAFPYVRCTSIRMSHRTLLHIIAPPRYRHVSHLART